MRREVWDDSKLQALVYDILQPLPYFVTPQGPENCQLTSSFFFSWCSNSSKLSLSQITQIIQGVSFIDAEKVYTSGNKTTIV